MGVSLKWCDKVANVMLWCDNGTYTTCVEPFNKELAKQFLKLMDALDLKDPEKNISNLD